MKGQNPRRLNTIGKEGSRYRDLPSCQCTSHKLLSLPEPFRVDRHHQLRTAMSSSELIPGSLLESVAILNYLTEVLKEINAWTGSI